MTGVADTNIIRHVVMWEIRGTGTEVGYGSEVRVLDGRVIGANVRFDENIGIHYRGNNGGVHVENTDVIGLGIGMLIDNSNGAGSNREIFINQATFDSDGQGLVVRDSSYVSIIGIWATSSTIHQVFVDYNSTAVLSISGGTIFNGGVYECPNVSNRCNGITINSGSFILNGVEVRNKHGRGIWVTNKSVTQFQIISCRLFENEQEMNSDGTSFIISNNLCNSNNVPNVISNTTSALVQDNLNC